MRVLFLSLIFAGYVLDHYAPDFMRQLDDYRESSRCIKEKIENGIARDRIIAIGNTCVIKNRSK